MALTVIDTLPTNPLRSTTISLR